MVLPPRDYLLGRTEAWASRPRLFLVTMSGAVFGLLWAYAILRQFAFTDTIVEFTVYITVTPLLITAGMIGSYVLCYQIEAGQESSG